MTLTQRPRNAPGRPGNAPEAKTADPGAPIPMGALEQHVAIVGRTGSGKSYAARGAVEGLLEAGRQVVVLDPTDVWWGLRAGADGGPGFPVPVIGGDRADVELPAEAGAALAATRLPAGVRVAGEFFPAGSEAPWSGPGTPSTI